MPRGVTLGPRFRDGLGVRVVEVEKTSGDTVEVLYLCPELCPFEKVIKDRSDRLSNFRHPRFGPVRGVHASSGPHGRVGVIADHIVGPRLSEVLEAAGKEKVAVDTNAALHLIRELLSAITAFHESRKVTHGAIGPERLIVTPRGRLVIVDYTLSLALERLQYNRTRLWRDFRIAMPPTARAAEFDQRADVIQIGTVAIALLIGRPLDPSDYTSSLEELLDGVHEVTVHGDRKPLSPALHAWLERALPLQARKPFGTARQANVALEQILIKERRLGVAPAALRAFINRYLSSAGGSATETHEAATDQLVQSAAETRPAAPLPETRGAPASQQEAASSGSDARTSPTRDAAPAPSAGPGLGVPSLTSAVIEGEPEVAGPFAATPFEIVPDAAPTPGPKVGSEIVSEVRTETTPERSSRAASGVASAVSSDVTMEVTSGIDPEFTVEIASGIIDATTLEKPTEVGSGGGPDVVTAEAAESRAPAPEAVAPPAEVPGITGFDADPGRILALEAGLGVAPKLPEPAAAASDDVWVIDPSDLTFDPAFLDGLYQPPRADLGTLIPEPPGKVGAEPAVKPLPPAVASAEPAATATDEARVAEAVAAPVTEAVPAAVALPADVIVAEAITEVAAQAGAEAATEAVDEAITEDAAPVAEPVTEAVALEEMRDVPEPPAATASPPASAAPVLEPLEVLPALEANWPFVQESPAPVADLVAKLAPGAQLTTVDTDVRRLARLEPRPTIGAVESVAEPGAKAGGPERPPDAVAPPAEAVPPAASVTPDLEPLDVLPALDASWPFVQESPEPVADQLKLVSKSPAAPAAAQAAGAETASVGTPPDATTVAEGAAAPAATTVAEAVPAPAATAVAEPVATLVAEPVAEPAAEPVAEPVAEAIAEPVVEAIAEPVAEPIVETMAPEGPTGGVAPPPGEELSQGGLVPDSAAASLPHATTAAEEGSGVLEAVKVFERLLESLQDTPATQTVTALPEQSGVPRDVAGETAASTVALVASPDESTSDQASLLGQVSNSAGPHVLIFQPPPVSGGPAVSAPPEEAPPAPAPPRLLTISVRETAARLARSVPKRLIDLGRTHLRWKHAAAAVLVMVALGGVRLATARWFKAPPPTGDLIVETVPDGLEVFVDNALRGRTPMSVTLPAGDHVLELRGKGLTRTLPVRIAPGVRAEERLSWPLSARTGRLRVESEPTKANVSIDGQPRGVTPLTVEDLPARAHTLVVQARGGRVERSVTIEPEQTTTVKVPVFPGWMKVFSPFDLRIFEGGRLLGNTDVDRIMLRAGRHTVEFVNEELGYRVVRQVDITPGTLTPVSMEPANGTLEIDAPPGFEVWLDGESVGQTPLAPLQVPLGTHDVRLTHPQSGEQRRTVVVTQREPARVTAESK